MSTTPSGRQTFRKPERLVSTAVFERLMRDGKSIHRPPLRLIFAPSALPSAFPAQIAFSVPKRIFRRAVDRNRIKRLLREAYRKNKSAVYPLFEKTGTTWALLLVFTGKSLPAYQEVEEKLQLILRQLAKDLQQSAG